MSASTSSPRTLTFTGKQLVQLNPHEIPATLEPGQVLVRTEFTLMSTGTENIVFNRLFDPGTHWDNWVKYPFTPGYSAVGTVAKVADEGVTKLKVGDRVAYRGRHRSHSVEGEAACVVIPDGIPFDQAVWFALAKIAFMGALPAEYRLGDHVLVIGAGPIGQMALRWAVAAGAASITVVDPVAMRLEMAKAGGATTVISLPIAEAREQVLAATGGNLPRIVVDSTGNAQVFAAALGLADKWGKVIVLGDTGSPVSQALTSDVITRGITIVGAHDGLNTPEWNGSTITKLIFTLVATNRFSLQGLTTHTFKPEACAEAYATANRERAKTMGIIFDWRD